MNPALGVLLDGLRVTVLRKPRGNPLLPGAGSFICALLVYILVGAIIGYAVTAPPRMLLPWGMTTILADAALTLVAAWILVRLTGREGILWAVAGITLAATAALSLLIHWPLQFATMVLDSSGHAWLAKSLEWLSQAWWLFVLIVLTRWLLPAKPRRTVPAAAIAFAVSALAWQWLQTAPLVITDFEAAEAIQVAENGSADDIAQGGFEEAVDDDIIEFDSEQVMYDQQRLLDGAIDALLPRHPGKANLYVVAFAGDGAENVFRNEAEYVEQLFVGRFDARGHIIVLENNPASVTTRPLATLTNLQRALQAIAEKMNPAEDILLVYLTSHGSSDHDLYVALDPLPLNQINPDDLAEALHTSPSMRWKVLVVNACYSGGFVEPLQDDSTLVITAARSDRTSFGCGAESEITYFGKAFLAQALNQTTSIPDAFVLARDTVATWEERDGAEKPSEPQIASSRSIEAKLETWRKTLADAPAVPFSPAANLAP